MISDIELIGVDDETLESLYDNLDSNELLSLACNYKTVNDSIEYLQSFGITVIDKLLINRSYIFLKDREELANAFKNVNIPVFVKLLNNDYNLIDELFN